MGLFDFLSDLFGSKEEPKDEGEQYEYCPRCNANLTLQKGYDNTLPCWTCLGCGEMLINPEVDSESNIAWMCDKCGAMLNIQNGFSEDCEEWECTECGFKNKIDASELYGSEEEYQDELKNPYRGLSDEEVLDLSRYEDIQCIGGKENIILIRDGENGTLFVKKMLHEYDKTIFTFLADHPVQNMPRIVSVYESSNCLIVIEEYIEGKTVVEMIESEPLSEDTAVHIVRCVSRILHELHSLETPIVHRDVKPSNIIVTSENEVYLLDMNVAKWFDPDQIDDTKYLGTHNYAAPEQVGYGSKASSEKTDVYAVGVLLNVMLTRHIPKEERVPGKLGDIIEKCIQLESKNRYTSAELCEELDKYEEGSR